MNFMDFNNLKQKFGDFTKTATEKAKELGNKALEFAGDNLAKTPLFVQDGESYTKLIAEKRAIILAFDEKNEIEKEVMMMLPVWQAQAFVDSATFRYMNNEKSDRLITEHTYTLPLEMRVFFEGNETLRLNTIEDIKTWWKQKNRDYKGENTKKSETKTEEKIQENTEETPIDPLSAK